jgi:CBS domain-containing protein
MGLRESLPQDKVDTLRPHEPVTMGPDAVVGDAIALMQDHSIGCVFVTEQGRPIGVFTERDVLRKVLPQGLPGDTPIVEVMTRDPQSIRETSTVAGVMVTMHQGGFRHMPVVDDAGCLKGVVSVKRVVEYLVEHFPSAVFNLPPEPAQEFTTREGA